jgi:hypothetical protein
MPLPYTKDDEIRLFRVLCQMLGRRPADKFYDVGALDISNIESEGGRCVVEIMDANGKVRVITRRMNLHEFHRFLESAIAVYAARDLAVEKFYKELMKKQGKRE